MTKKHSGEKHGGTPQGTTDSCDFSDNYFAPAPNNAIRRDIAFINGNNNTINKNQMLGGMGIDVEPNSVGEQLQNNQICHNNIKGIISLHGKP